MNLNKINPKMTNDQLVELLALVKEGKTSLEMSSELIIQIDSAIDLKARSLTVFCEENDINYHKTQQLINGSRKNLTSHAIELCNVLKIRISEYL